MKTTLLFTLVLCLITAANAAAQLAANPQTARAEQLYHKRLQKAGTLAKAGADHCNAQRIQHNSESHVEYTRCINHAIDTAYQRAGYLYPDLTEVLNEKRMDIAQREDRKEITEAQGNQEMQALAAQVASEEIAREKKRLSPPPAEPSDQ